MSNPMIFPEAFSEELIILKYSLKISKKPVSSIISKIDDEMI
jgi:hypothetical protein